MAHEGRTAHRVATRSDTVRDAEVIEYTVSTPLVFAAQPTEDIATTKEEELADSTYESRVEFPGPQRWEESYHFELKTEADRILSNFKKTPVDSSFEATLPAVPPVWEENLVDRLGRGYLDPSTLSLQSPESAASHVSGTARRSMGAVQFARLTSRMGIHSRSASRAREERRRQELRDRVLPSSGNFSPDFYLSHVHADSSLAELQEGLRFLEVELSKRTGQLKTLVKEHFEGFISCKNSIDDVHVRLRRNEAQNSGANTASLKASIATVHLELSQSYAPILERYGKLEHLKHVMEILKRFQSSFNLPSNIRQLSQNRDFQQIVTEYRRAKSTMAGAEAKIWRSLFEEVKKETTDVCVKINKSLEDPQLDVDEVQQLVVCLCHLRHEGLEFTGTLEPASTWLMNVEDFLHQEMDKLTAMHRRKADGASHELMRKRATSVFERPTPDAADVTGAGQCTLPVAERCTGFVTKLCRLLVEHLPKIWRLKRNPELQQMPDVHPDIQSDIKAELDNVDIISRGVLDSFNGRIVQSMERMLSSEGLLSPFVFTVLKELRLFASDMKGCPAPCLTSLTGLVHECFEMCVTYLCTYLRQQMASLGEWEDWKVQIGSYRRGHPVTSVPYKLGQAVRDVMEQFRLINAEQEQWSDDTIHVEAKCLNNAFNECFESFAMAVEGLAAEILEPKERSTVQNVQMPEISKLLILISNSMYIRQRILPELTAQYSSFILGSSESDALKLQFEKLEEQMEQAFIDHAKKITEKAVDATVAAEKEFPPMKLVEFRASEPPSEWIAVIADTHAELLKYAPSKCESVITVMVLHLVRRVKFRLQDLSHLGFLLQMYIDVMFVDNVFKGVDVKEVHKAWDAVYERLNTLICAQIRSMKAMDKDMESPEEDAGMNVLNVFSDGDLEDVMKLDKKLQKMFKDGVKESIKGMNINLASMRMFKAKDKPKASQR